MRVKPFAAVILLTFVSVASAQTSRPLSLNNGQTIEVREGDTWSKATIVRREGRKYLVHYEGADAPADEWVMPDRVRAVGATDSATPGAAAAAPATPPPTQ